VSDEVVISMTAEDRDVMDSFRSQGAETDKLKGKLATLTSGTDALGRSYKNLGNEARKVLEATQSPLEKLIAQNARLNLLAERGLISEEKRAKAYSQALGKFHAATGGDDAETKRKAQEAIAAAEAKEAEAIATRKASEADRTAAAVYDKTRTSLEKYSAERKKLLAMRQAGAEGKAGGIDEETYRRGVEQAGAALMQAQGMQAGKAAAGVKEMVTAQIAAVTQADKLRAKLGQLSDAFAKGSISEKQFAADSAKVKAELQKVESAAGGVGSSVIKGTAEVARFLAAFTGIGSVAAGMLVIVMQVKREYENLKERHKTAADKTREYAVAEKGAFKAFGGLLSPEELKAHAIDLSKETGVSPYKVMKTIEGAAAAAGATTKEDAEKAIADAKERLLLSPEESSESLAVGAAATGATRARTGMTSKEAAGYGLKVAALSSTKGEANLTTNTIPAVNKVLGMGATEVEAGSLVAAMSKSMNDLTGEESGSQSIRFKEQLNEVLGDLPLDEQLAIVDANPKLKKALEHGGGTWKGKRVNKIETRAGGTVAVREMLTAGSKTRQWYDENRAEFGDRADYAKMVDSTRAAMAASPHVKLDTVARRSEANADRQALGDLSGAETGIAREAMTANLKAAKVSDLSQKIALATFEGKSGIFEEGSLTAAEGELRKEAGRRLATTETVQSKTNYAGVRETVPRTPSAEDERIGSGLLELADTIKEAVKELKEIKDETKKKNNRDAKVDAKPPPRRVEVPIVHAAHALTRTP